MVKAEAQSGKPLRWGRLFGDLSHAEERDDGLIDGLNGQDLEGGPRRRDTLQSGDTVYGGIASGYNETD